MDVIREGRTWRMRWLTTAATQSIAPAAPAASDDAMLEELCACCGDGGTWVAVPDLPSMPKPSAVYDCPRCRRTTAHTDLPVTMRSIGD